MILLPLKSLSSSWVFTWNCPQYTVCHSYLLSLLPITWGEDSGEYFFLAFLSLWSFQYVGFSKISLSFSPPFIFPNWYVLIWHWYKKCSLFFQPTSPHRGWFVPPFGGNPWWVYLAAAIPALLVTILIFMDQQITAVIVNRKEHKLKVSVYSTGYSCLLLYL